MIVVILLLPVIIIDTLIHPKDWEDDFGDEGWNPDNPYSYFYKEGDTND